MRVIAGKYKGRSLKAVPGKETRPTTDKVKEALFNLIQSVSLDQATILDLYAGTGGLAIEAISRGASTAICIDIQTKAISTIRENLTALGIEEQVEVYRNEASKALDKLRKRDLTFRVIFLDPPYAKQNIIQHVSYIAEHSLLEQGGCIVAETDKGVVLPEEIADYYRWKHQLYGDTAIHIYRKKEEA